MAFFRTGIGLVLLLASTTYSQAKPATDSVHDLKLAEDGYTRAVVSRDIGALAATLDDDLIYIHAAGIAQDKAQYLKGTVDGGFRVVGTRITDREASVFGNIGVTLGRIYYDVGSGEKPARYMAVYRRHGRHWLLLRWQNARLATPN